jgi:hypothetical protein
MKYIVIFAILILITTTSCTSGYSTIGIGTSYFKENQDDYKTDYEPRATVNFTHIAEFKKKVAIGYSTNRPEHLISDRNTYNITLKNGIKAINQQKVTTDTLLVGKRFGRWLPMANLTNARVDNKFIINNNVKRKINTALLYGASVTYFINEEYSTSLAYVLGNEELGIDYGLLATISLKL